jgi:excisionase family DNA binding protein
MHKPILTTHDIAGILSVDMSTVIDWIDRKKLPAYRTPGGHRRVKRADFLAFLKEYDLSGAADLGSAGNVVLVVEDDADFRKAVTDLVRSRRPEAAIHEAEDGFTAGRKLQELKPDVVVLDLFLPGIDGFKVCSQIRADPDLADTRVVAMSGYDTPENRRRIKEAGADVFLPKPLGLAQLGETVDRLLSREKAEAAR